MRHIDRLDLRDPEVIQHQRQETALDRMWDWPEFPPRVAVFLATGKVPRELAVTWKMTWRYRTLATDIADAQRKLQNLLEKIKDESRFPRWLIDLIVKAGSVHAW